MKQLKLIRLLVFTAVITSCNQSSLEGKKYYLLTGSVNYNNFYANLKEIEFNFITEDKVEAKMTLYADAFGYKIIPSDSKEAESKIYNYKYEKGLLELPDLKKIAKMEELSDGTIKTNEGEYFYTSSLVPLIGTQAALKRVDESSRNGMSRIFKKFLEKPQQPLIKQKGGKIIIYPADNKNNTKDDLINEYNNIISQLNLGVSEDEQLEGSLGEKYNAIKQLKKEIRDCFESQAFSKDKTIERLKKLKSMIDELNNGIKQLNEENKRLSESNK